MTIPAFVPSYFAWSIYVDDTGSYPWSITEVDPASGEVLKTAACGSCDSFEEAQSAQLNALIGLMDAAWIDVNGNPTSATESAELMQRFAIKLAYTRARAAIGQLEVLCSIPGESRSKRSIKAMLDARRTVSKLVGEAYRQTKKRHKAAKEKGGAS